jgi:hypothetical protein
MRMRRPLFVVALMLLAASCAKATAPSPAATPANGMLVITQEMARGGGVYIEGYVPFVTVAQNGHEIFSSRMQLDQALSHELSAGSYQLTFTVRGCDASCARLDPPSESCSNSFTVEDGQTVRAHAIERPAQGCSISFES